MERTCVGCRRVRPKPELLRIVRSPEGLVRPDPAGTEPGRGAYVCGLECYRLARGRLRRALRAPDYDDGALEAAVTAVTGET